MGKLNLKQLKKSTYFCDGNDFTVVRTLLFDRDLADDFMHLFFIAQPLQDSLDLVPAGDAGNLFGG